MLRNYVAVLVPIIAIVCYVRLHKGERFGEEQLDVPQIQLKIEEMLRQTWSNYRKYAWGWDSYSPISHAVGSASYTKAPVGWTIVDSADTLLLAYNYSKSAENKEYFLNETYAIQDWIKNTLDYSVANAEMSVFETTIRLLGGLLSSYYLSNEMNVGDPQVYLDRAIQLADRLAPAFNKWGSGIPSAVINLSNGNMEGIGELAYMVSTAECTTLQMEFKYLSVLTGNDTYWKLTENVYKKLYEANDILGAFSGLAPIRIVGSSGKFQSMNFRFGSRGDSFYEYLLKQYLVTHEELYYKLYRAAMNGMKRHLLKHSYPHGLTYIAERPSGLRNKASSKMDHLVCFMGGLLAMGATQGLPIEQARRMSFWDSDRADDWELAKQLTYTCYQLYHQSPAGLGPEIVIFNTDNDSDDDFVPLKVNDQWWKSQSEDFYVKPTDSHNLQRPETVESIMFLYHLTKDQKYRRWGYEILMSFDKNACINCDDPGSKTFVSLDNCMELPTKRRDATETFWVSETLKYLYLLFQDDIDLTKYIFNTEAHPFPVLEQSLLDEMGLKTGWSI